MANTYTIIKTSADISNSTTTLSDLTGLNYAIAANQIFRFEFVIPFSSAATTTGLALAVTCPASPTWISYTCDIPVAADGVSAMFHGWGTSSADKVIGTGVQAANTVYLASITGAIRNGANAGTLQVQFCSEVAASAVIAKMGAWGIIDGSGGALVAWGY